METCPSCMFLESVQNSQSRNFKKGINALLIIINADPLLRK